MLHPTRVERDRRRRRRRCTGEKHVGRAALFAVLVCIIGVLYVDVGRDRKAEWGCAFAQSDLYGTREKVAHVGAARAWVTFRVRPLSTRPDLNAPDVQFPTDNRTHSH